MTLNLTPEVIVDFIVAISGFVLTITTYIKPKTKKITSLNYIRLSIFSFSVFIFLDGLSLLYISKLLSIISGFILVPLTLSLVIGITYIIKENFYSPGFVIVIGLSVLLIYLGFQPNAVDIQIQGGYIRLPWTGLFNDIGMILTAISEVYMLYWGIKTLKNAPFLIKKEAYLFFLGIFFASVVAMFFYVLYLIDPFYILISNFALLIGLLIVTLSAMIEPKLLYILPFTVYRIVVKDREGYPLFDHDWSKSEISENIFTGFINAIQLMSEEIMNMGGLLDIQLDDGILILHESENITVGLITSKSSKLLRYSVTNFTCDFENKFEKILKEGNKDMREYESAHELIEKYFSNFPSRIISHKRKPLLLTERLLKLPLTLDTDLKKIFKDEEEFNFIKSEIYRTPESTAAGFISLYKELKNELDDIENEYEKS
ncbi:MAG: hypothetical protein CEE42_01560 [Promethearchaeota archaeon Loki_b31]|nr:MAG: hypothetical protein CEE42_01560 [Candidatus Lokiarchaeota archaeon Loki_b31]